MAVGYVGMSVEHRLDFRRPGALQQGPNAQLHMVLMAVGQVEIHPEYPIDENLRLIRRAAIPVAVSRHLIKGNAGIFLPEHFPIAKIVPQMDHPVRADEFHAPAHKAQAGMRIGKDKNRHKILLQTHFMGNCRNNTRQIPPELGHCVFLYHIMAVKEAVTFPNPAHMLWYRL